MPAHQVVQDLSAGAKPPMPVFDFGHLPIGGPFHTFPLRMRSSRKITY
jgi:hypothetical protein